MQMLSQMCRSGIKYENTVTNGDIGLNKQVLLMSHSFIIYSKIVLSFTQIIHTFSSMLSNSSAEDLFYVGKGYTFTAQDILIVI